MTRPTFIGSLGALARTGRSLVNPALAASAAPGARIPYDSPFPHPGAWVSGDFNYASKAAWLAAEEAKPTYEAAVADTGSIVFDTVNTHNGHPVIRGTGVFGHSTSAHQIAWFRYGMHVPAPLTDSPLIEIFGNTSADWVCDAGAQWAGTGEWLEISNADLVDAQATGEIEGQSLIIVQKIQRINNSSYGLTLWVSGVKAAATSTHASYGVLTGFTSLLLNPNNSRILDYEAINGDGLAAPPYTNLGL